MSTQSDAWLLTQDKHVEQREEWLGYHHQDWPINPPLSREQPIEPAPFTHQADIPNPSEVWAITRDGVLVRLYVSEEDARRNVARVNRMFQNCSQAIVSKWTVFSTGTD
jgi:hypothetical protein